MSTSLLNSPRTTEYESAQTYRLTAPAAVRTVRIAREYAAAVLVAAGHTALVDDARVCVSEVTTNVLRHTRVPRIDVEVTIGDARVIIAVHDSNPAALPLPREARTDEEVGRGLYILNSLVCTWGTTFVWDGHDIVGKRVWFELCNDSTVLA
ncbi:ATP-binding protein [Streptomyces sp. ET3-23]|uniref:ATP-binding protein n=1 Tax=Streptomyces sp. ET3-23 TaxID=2885643 RepID=UPI001D113074|nr:ATP-binding protein [Streptomyces sp. ET3-23]MCC2280585.1 ATP-binding protein [Streptomyces sp. ET3-23]